MFVRALTGACLSICAMAVHAQAAVAAPATLGDGLRQVWLTHPEVLRANAEIQASQFDVSGARAGYYPNFQLQNVQSNRSAEVGGAGRGTIVRLTQPLYSGGSTGAEVDNADARREQAESNLASTRLDLALRYSEAHFGALAASSQVKALEDNLQSLRKLFASITRRAEEGAAPESDVKTAITRLRQAESQLTQARAQDLVQRQALRSLLSVEPGRLTWPHRAALTTGEMSDVLERALQLNPNHTRADAEIRAQEAQGRLSRARLTPEVSLQYSRGMGGISESNQVEQTQLIVAYQTDNGFRAFENYRGALKRVEAAQSRKASVLRDIEQSIVADRLQQESLVLQLRSQRLAVDSASQLVDSYLRQYVVGRKTWIEVLNAQREATDTVIQFIGLQQNYWQTATRLALNAMYWDEWVDRTSTEGVTDVMEIRQ